MAYISDQVITVSTAAASKAADMPVHASGNLLLAIISNDTGGTTITVTAGWTQVTTQSANLTQRVAIYYKIAASSSETFTASGANDDWNITMMTIQEFDATTPIHASARFDMPSTAATCASPALTTTNNNCLLVYGWSFRVPSAFAINPNDLVNVAKPANTDASRMQTVGYRQQFTAGAIPSVTALTDTASRGGTSVVIAINDAGNNKLARSVGSSTKTLSRYGAFGNLDGTTTALTANKMSTTSITSLGGVSVSSTAPSAIASDTFTIAPYGTFLRITMSETAGAGLIVGTWHSISATDFSNGVFHVNWAYAGITNATTGSDGVMVGFEDASGNYAVFRITKPTKLTNSELYASFIACDKATPIYSSGTIDWSAVTRIIYCIHRIGAADGSRLYIRDAAITTTNTLIGGNVDTPLNPTFLQKVMEGWGQYDLVKYQGLGQVINRTPVQIGDGSSRTYYDSKGTSFEFPLPYDADSLTSRFVNTPAQSLNYIIKASANDTILFRSCLMSTSVGHHFTIDAASSTSATYSFAGLVMSGYYVTGKAGIDFNEVTFDGCYLINLLGGGLINSFVTNSLNSIAVTTTDPEQISDTAFTSAGTGHAIEITTPGSYDFAGNSFTGYGADGTTDAAIYNNSGGAVELIIPSGDDTPTIRDGTSASTTITQPTDNQSVTISGATAGSRIQIYDLTSNTELYNGTPTFPYTWTDTNPYVADREIRLRVAYVNGTSAKQFIDTVIGTSTSTTPAVAYQVNQQDDTVYNSNAIDGSTITTVTIDDNNLLIEVDTGTISVKDVYAYEMYWLFTATGIADEGKAIVAVDVANYAIYGFKIKNVSSPSVPLTITGGWVTDGDTGVAIDIVDTTGGTIFLAPDHVVAYATGSGVTPTDKTDIIEGVWDELLSGHTTSGSAGNILTNVADDADTAANK